jgi:signal transduction histidine kinase
MNDPPAERRTDYFVRALAVVLGGTFAHLAIAELLAWLIVEPSTGEVPREAIHVSVLATGVVLLATLYVRTQYSSPSHVTRSIPIVMRVAPPASLLLLSPLLYPAEVLQGPLTPFLATLAPPVCASWAAAWMVSILVKRVLHALGIRTPAASIAGILRSFDPPPLATGYVRVLAGVSFTCALVVVGAWLPRAVASNAPMTAAELAPIAGLFAITALAALAGMSLGQSPGEDVVSIARRLDNLGYGSGRPLASPIVVTSFDEVGELLANLERLRARLRDDLELYEDALDRTKQADALKADFLSAVSHELRTPLNSVGGFAQLLLEGHGGALTEPQVEDVRLIRAGGHQLLELLNDILDISMIESGELRLHFQRTDIGELIREVVDIHRPLVRDRGVKMRAEVGPELPVVVCDRRRIGQILTNLVSNAIKFTEAGEIVVRGSWDPHGDRILIRCIDTGVGIAADELDAIFEEYRQAGPVKRRKKGTGLGLSIARTIAEHHGGSLHVESTPGEGSTFTLTLPREPPERPQAIDMAERAARARAAREAADTPEASP